MPQEEHSGVDTRQQKERRGFHRVKAPGFLGTREAFEEAARKNPEITKKAVLDACALCGVKIAKDDPLKDLSKLFQKSNFGYADDAFTKTKGHKGDDRDHSTLTFWSKQTGTRPSGGTEAARMGKAETFP